MRARLDTLVIALFNGNTDATDSKLAIKIINRLNKLAKALGFQQRRTYVKEVKSLRLSIQFPPCEEKSQGQESIETP